jgi:hypothetical protein
MSRRPLVALAMGQFALADSASAFAQGGCSGGISSRNVRPYVQTQTKPNKGYLHDSGVTTLRQTGLAPVPSDGGRLCSVSVFAVAQRVPNSTPLQLNQMRTLL